MLLVYICRDEEIFARARTVSGSRSLSTEGLLYLGLHAIGKVEEGQVTTDQLISQTFKGGGEAYDMLEGVDVQFILFHKC